MDVFIVGFTMPQLYAQIQFNINLSAMYMYASFFVFSNFLKDNTRICCFHVFMLMLNCTQMCYFWDENDKICAQC